MRGRVLLYGAGGHCGAQIASRLADLGEALVLAGRRHATVAPVAERLGLSSRIFGLELEEDVDRALVDVSVVLHAAGPFARTAAPMMRACLRGGVDYVDIAGEWPVFLAAMQLGEAARAANVMLLPGAGVANAVTDALLAMAVEAVPDAARLRVAISRPHPLSRGSVATAAGLMDSQVLVRRDGVLRQIPAGRLARDFDFGEGPSRAVAFAWPDVVTASFTTGARNVEAYCEASLAARTGYRLASGAARLSAASARKLSELWPQRPAAHALEGAGYTIVAEAEDRWRRVSALRLRIADGYSTTRETASAIVRRVLSAERRPGFQTAGRLFGGRFALGFGELATPLPVAAAASECAHDLR